MSDSFYGNDLTSVIIPVNVSTIGFSPVTMPE